MNEMKGNLSGFDFAYRAETRQAALRSVQGKKPDLLNYWFAAS
jgi:hypothetical protein